MPFTISDFHDLVVLLEEHPQWRAELRRLVLTEDILALPRIVQELAEAQKRTEAQVRELFVSVRELAEAQKRTEAQVRELFVSVRELAAAQQRTEAQVRELAAAQQRTEARLTRLENRIGVSLEEEAADVLRVVLETKGYRATEAAYSLALNGEVDVVLPLQDAQGQRVWAVLEAKVRLGWRAVEAWAKRMYSSDFQDALRAAGVSGPYLVYAYGMRFDLSARQAADKFGIGLLSSRGEEVPPRETPNG